MKPLGMDLTETVSVLDRETARGEYMEAARVAEIAESIVAYKRHCLNEAELLLRESRHKERLTLLRWMAETDEVTKLPEIVDMVDRAVEMERLLHE